MVTKSYKYIRKGSFFNDKQSITQKMSQDMEMRNFSQYTYDFH